MAPVPSLIDTAQSASGTMATDPTFPAGIAQVVVAFLTPTLAATVDTTVQRALEHFHTELQNQAQHISQAEERISLMEDDTTAHAAALACLTQSNKELCEKLDDIENCSRRNNLRIIGLPESFSNAQLADICVVTIPEQLSLRAPCIIEHRIGQRTEQCAKPRAVIVKYLYYADKHAILQKFCIKRTLSIDGADLLFTDYSIEVMKQAFSSICLTLFNNHVKFTLPSHPQR